jgi:hypothetical protein
MMVSYAAVVVMVITACPVLCRAKVLSSTGIGFLEERRETGCQAMRYTAGLGRIAREHRQSLTALHVSDDGKQYSDESLRAGLGR